MTIGRTGRLMAGTAALLLAACGTETAPTAPDPGGPLFAKPADKGGGNGGGNGGGKGGDEGDDGGGSTTVLVAYVDGVDYTTADCLGTVTDNYGVLFGHQTCITIPLDDYSLTDDITFNTKTRKGEIVEMYLTGQDVIGEEGIMHETDNFLDTPVTPDPVAGFTVTIDQEVPVYRLSGHLRGRRVGVVGHVYIGYIVYEPESQ